jgi:hypothetical protein
MYTTLMYLFKELYMLIMLIKLVDPAQCICSILFSEAVILSESKKVNTVKP